MGDRDRQTEVGCVRAVYSHSDHAALRIAHGLSGQEERAYHLRQAGRCGEDKNVSRDFQEIAARERHKRVEFPRIEASVCDACFGNENGHKNIKRAPRVRVRGGDYQDLLSFDDVSEKRGDKPAE